MEAKDSPDYPETGMCWNNLLLSLDKVVYTFISYTRFKYAWILHFREYLNASVDV